MATPKPTLRAVAARARVAPSTASLIIRGEGRFAPDTVDRVIRTARAMGYVSGNQPSQLLEPGNTNVAGVVTFASIAATLRDGHSQDIIRGLHAGLAERGIALMLLPPVDSHGFAQTLRAMPLDIVFMLSTFHELTEVAAIARERGIAFAYLESAGDDAPQPTIRVDDVPPMRELAQHLVALGHTCIATVTMRFSTYAHGGLVPPTPVASIDNPITRGRLQGLHEGGLPPSYVYETRRASREEAADAAHILMRMDPRPTAIVCHTDVLAEGVMIGLKDLGLDVPVDVSVTGYDGNAIPSLAPHRLTTVLQDGVLKGTMLARIGSALRDGERPPQATLETYFMAGTTTGPAPVPTGASAPTGPGVGPLIAHGEAP